MWCSKTKKHGCFIYIYIYILSKGSINFHFKLLDYFMFYDNNHTTCIVFSGWLSSVFQIGKAAPPSPSKDKKKDMGSPLRNPGSPMRKNSQSDRRYLQYRSFTTLIQLQHNIWPTAGAVFTGRQWRSGPGRRGPRLMWTDTRSGSERFTKQRLKHRRERMKMCVHLKKYRATQRMCSPPLIIHLVE